MHIATVWAHTPPQPRLTSCLTCTSSKPEGFSAPAGWIVRLKPLHTETVHRNSGLPVESFLTQSLAPLTRSRPRLAYQDPVANDVKYQAAAQPFLVFGILCTAVAVGHHTF